MHEFSFRQKENIVHKTSLIQWRIKLECTHFVVVVNVNSPRKCTHLRMFFIRIASCVKLHYYIFHSDFVDFLLFSKISIFFTAFLKTEFCFCRKKTSKTNENLLYRTITFFTNKKVLFFWNLQKYIAVHFSNFLDGKCKPEILKRQPVPHEKHQAWGNSRKWPGPGGGTPMRGWRGQSLPPPHPSPPFKKIEGGVWEIEPLWHKNIK